MANYRASTPLGTSPKFDVSSDEKKKPKKTKKKTNPLDERISKDKELAARIKKAHLASKKRGGYIGGTSYVKLK